MEVNILQMQISQIEKKDIKYIGEFNIKANILYGESFDALLNLKKDVYHAFNLDNNLLILHQDFFKSDKDIILKISELTKLIWNYEGSIGVDGGMYGFIDSTMIQYIKDNDEMKEGILKDKNNAFGVIIHTGSGDGIFSCYKTGDYGALLISNCECMP